MNTADKANDSAFDIGRLLFETSNTHAELVRNGVRVAEIRINPALRNLRACFNKASKDADSRIPTYLTAAIVNALALITEQPAPSREPCYQERADGGGDIGPGGTQLQPGS